MLILLPYSREMQSGVSKFFSEIFPVSGNAFGEFVRNSFYANMIRYFDDMWCLCDNGSVVGITAMNRINEEKCELSGLYLFESYQGQRLGYKMLMNAIDHARKKNYKQMYLGTTAKSERAISLYKRNGFTFTKRYNDDLNANVFMVLDLDT